jgi:chondroitin AC lyase
LRERQPLPGQWWQNTIGQPLLLSRTLVPLGDVLPSDLLRQGLRRFVAPAETGPEVRGRLRLHYPTAEDLVWFAQQQLIRGTLARSSEDVAEASSSIQEVILVSTNDGIQPDFTFHTHGSELYNGGYGHDFILDTCKYATVLEGTRFAFTHESSRYLPTIC